MCRARGRGLLLLGASGAGKSTLALHALLDGMDFLAEDGVFVQPESMSATGVANFLHVKRDVSRFIDDAAVRDWIETSPEIHRRSGVAKFEVDLREGAGHQAPAPLRVVGAIVVSAETAVDPTRLLRRLPWEHMASLLAIDQPYAAAQPGWDRFVHRLGGLGTYELRRGSHPRGFHRRAARLARGRHPGALTVLNGMRSAAPPLHALLRSLPSGDRLPTLAYVVLSLMSACAGSVATVLLVALVQPSHALPLPDPTSSLAVEWTRQPVLSPS